MFVLTKNIERKEVSAGINRKVLAYSENVMMCDFLLSKGAILAEHHHPHEQITYVISGKGRFIVGGEEKVLTAGDSVYMGSDVPHKVEVIEEMKCVDVFVPMRKEFVPEQK